MPILFFCNMNGFKKQLLFGELGDFLRGAVALEEELFELRGGERAVKEVALEFVAVVRFQERFLLAVFPRLRRRHRV